MSPMQIQQLSEMRQWAEMNPITLSDIHEMIEGKRPPIGDNENFVLYLEGMRIVFSIEEQPVGKVRHVSISRKEGPVSTSHFAMIEKWLGFEEAPVQMWTEKFDGRIALNVAQVMRS